MRINAALAGFTSKELAATELMRNSRQMRSTTE